MKDPAHPGNLVREILAELGLSVTEAASVLGVIRPAASAVINERASLLPEMAPRIEKAFGVSMDTLMRMQNNHDIARAREREGEINVDSYVAKPKDAGRAGTP